MTISTNETFCVLPFKHMQISNNGVVRLCCQSPGLEDEAGTPITVYEHRAADIWNSDAMQNVRRSLIEGRKIANCASCWKQEASGGTSRRIQENALFMVKLGWWPKLLVLLRGNKEKLNILNTEPRREKFVLQNGPSDLEIEVGNLCNLKCRMCSPTYSSKIEQDPVHSKWYSDVAIDQHSHPSSRFSAKVHWFKEKTFTYGELLNQPKRIRKLTFKGGEPFASKDAINVLEYLNKEGEPAETEIHVVTNGTIADPKLLGVIGGFKRFFIAASLDGIGDLHEYIRYPAKWSAVSENIQLFSKQSNVTLLTSITFQAYNCLRIVELFRFCDQMNYRINLSTLTYPAHLAAAAMPPSARKVAAKRLNEYVETDCKRQNKKNIRALAIGLEEVDDQLDVENLKRFMVFTNDLDQSRGQRFKNVNSELLCHIEDAGIPWTQGTRFF